MFLSPHVKARKTKQKGKGVFATAEIAPGTLIGDYLGIITKPDQGLEYEKGAVYDMWYSDKADICPKPEDDGVHLINTSCEPNCGMTALGRRTILFALRRIFPGEELSYDYFMGDQDDECDPGTDNCHCGSDYCRGTMYSNPTAYEAWDEHLEEIMGDLPEEPPVAYGEQLPPLDEYPEAIEDAPIYPMWGTHEQRPVECKTAILSDLPSLRAKIRESGCHVCFPEIGIVVEGIMYGGHIAMTHLSEYNEQHTYADKTSHAQDKKVTVSASA